MAFGDSNLLRTIERWTVPNLKLFHESRQPVVWMLAPFIGLATGGAAILFRLAIGAFQWPWLHSMSESVAAAAKAQPWWVILLAPAVGGLLVGLMLQFVLTAKRTWRGARRDGGASQGGPGLVPWARTVECLGQRIVPGKRRRAPPGKALSAPVQANDVASARQILQVDDLAATVRRFEKEGMSFVSPGVATLKNGGKAASIRDPDGHMIVLLG